MFDAIYARQSIYREGSISIETQVEMSEKACKNPVRYYKDAGFSGGNTNRPEFQRMMRDIESGIIQRVVVYRLDRISRSLLDFADTWTSLDKHGVKFVSVTENFDTSSPMGQAMLYIAAVFAELERKDIVSRVKDNYYARSKSGYWLGGSAPFGFDLNREDGAGKGVLQPNKHIETVKRIFKEYAVPLVSLSEIAKELNEENIAAPRSYWSAINLSRILFNPCYVKADVSIYSYYKNLGIEIFSPIEEFTGTNGCQLLGKTVRDKNRTKTTGTTYNKRTLANMRLVVSQWDGVIEPELFLKCLEKLETNQQLGKNGAGKHTWLSGLIKCGECHYALCVSTEKRVNGERAKSLRCSGRITRKVCEAMSFPHILDLEQEVQRAIEKVLSECKTMEAQTEKNPELNIEIYKVEEEINNLLTVLKSSVASEKVIGIVNAEMTRLTKLHKKLLEEQQKKKVPIILEKINFDELSFDEKKKVAYTYIKKIDVFVKPSRICIEWKL